MMLKYGILAAAAVTVATAVGAEPQVTWLKTTLDFGAFAETDGAAHARFGAVNTGSAPLVITAARANCGCTTPRYSADAVAPGDTAWVDVAYDPQGRPGSFEKKVYVQTNTTPSRHTLTIRGTVIGSPATVAARYPVRAAGLSLERGALLMGAVKKNRVKTSFLGGYNATSDSMRVALVSSPKWIDVSFVPPVVAPGTELSIGVYADANRQPLYGIVTDTITVSVNGTPAAIPVVLNVEEDFGTPSDKDLARAPQVLVEGNGRFDAGSVPAGQPVTGTYTLRNIGQSALAVRRVYSGDSGVEVSVDRKTVKPGKTAVVTVTAPAQAVRAGVPLNVRAAVIVNDPLNPVHTLRLTAEPR